MEVEFWFDSATDTESNGDFIPYRVIADIPDPYSIDVFNDLTNEVVLFTALSPQDRAKIFAELNLRTSEYVAWTDKKHIEVMAEIENVIKVLNEEKK